MRRLFRPLRTSLLMLLLAAFVVVPVADALACALEPESADAVHTPAAAHADGDDSDGKLAGSCSHNHCHHSNLSLPASALAVFGAPRPARWMQATDASPAGVVQDGLKRPPRA
ncbi:MULTISPECIES: hypothetical protein [Xanthomonas]|uniref:Uncharacterized protein n=1 Tax=Xanthomonas indica TaxID=2912242 RepID=A0AAU8I853_9XANT|nr:hypothetical protein [Xanthomonas indica]MCI2260440.1 hypothetical protein [Xanthomonas indica]